MALALGAFAAVQQLSPAVRAHTPQVGTSDRTPRATLFLEHAQGLKAEHVTARIDGERLPADAVGVSDDSISIQLPRLREGTYELRVRTDRFGLTRGRIEHRSKFVVDSTAPTIDVTHPSGRRVRSNVRNTRFSIETEARSSVTFEVEGKQTKDHADDEGRVAALVSIPEGRHFVSITARDRVGNKTTMQQRVFVDSIAPELSTDLPGVLTSASFRTEGTVRDATGVTITADVNNAGEELSVRQPTATDPAWAIARADNLAEGVHAIDITATDRLGNHTTVRRSVLVNSSEKLGDNALRRGARGADVRQLHERLRTLDLWSAGENSREWRLQIYGPATTRAVRNYQASEGLEVDGEVGNATLARMTLKIVIDRAQHTLTLFRLGEVVKTYNVAVGAAKFPTPAGSYEIVVKEKDPTWNPPDSDWAKDAKPIKPGPNNPLGTRWMGLDRDALGIHGTNSPASIGYSVSHGCIRMLIPDVEELFERVEVGTPVTIV